MIITTASNARMFQYPLFRIVDCFFLTGPHATWLTEFQYPLFRIVDCFAQRREERQPRLKRFNIRSFGSWIASGATVYSILLDAMFQYPLFRIVDCFPVFAPMCRNGSRVSISALSDRGLLQRRLASMYTVQFRVSISALSDRGLLRGILAALVRLYHVSISALSDRGLLRQQADVPVLANKVSISALSDRGLLPRRTRCAWWSAWLFQYPLFRIVDCFIYR